MIYGCQTMKTLKYFFLLLALGLFSSSSWGQPSCQNDITKFTITGYSFGVTKHDPNVKFGPIVGVITESKTDPRIDVTVPHRAIISVLKPTITYSKLASINPDPKDNETQDFTNPVTYTIISCTDIAKTYVVIVTVEQ